MESFDEWIVRTGRRGTTAITYLTALSGNITEWANNLSLHTGSLLDIQEVSKFERVIDGIQRDDAFRDTNDRSHRRYSSAMSNYLTYLEERQPPPEEEDIDEILSRTTIHETTKKRLIDARLGQGAYRNSLLAFWGRCAITGLQNPEFLIASHIKPWRNSSNTERLDHFNGLLLIPNLDRAFDLGYIGFSDCGILIVSPQLKSSNVLGITENAKIKVAEAHKPYLSYHRNHVLRGT